MKRKPKQHSLTIYLSKKGTEAKNCLSSRKIEEFGAHEIKLKRGLQGVLYVYNTKAEQPGWVAYLTTGLDDVGRRKLTGHVKAGASNSGALVLKLPKKDRHVILTFGYGKSLVDYAAIEQFFGRNVILNSVPLDKILAIKSQSYHKQPRHKEDQASITTSFYDFELDLENEILKKLTAEYEDKDLVDEGLDEGKLGVRVTGYDSATITSCLYVPEIHEACTWLCKKFEDDSYKTALPYIDSFAPVKDTDLKANLDEALCEKIDAEDLEGVHLVIPFFIDHAEYNQFTVTGLGKARKEELTGEFPPIEEVVSAIKSRLGSGELVAPDQLKRNYRLQCISKIEPARNLSTSIYRCLTAEILHEGNQYSLMGGDWYRIDSGFFNGLVSRLNKKVSDCSITFDPFDVDLHKDEKGYNVHQAKHKGLLNFDRDLVPLHGRGKIEVCDLLSGDAEFIHVKRYQGSADLSHLFSQGTVAIRTLAGDEKFREKFLGKISNKSLRGRIRAALKKRKAQIVFVVLMEGSVHKKKEKKILNLPAFSIVNLNKFVKDLNSMGFQSKIHFVFG